MTINLQTIQTNQAFYIVKAFMNSQIVISACELGIPDLLSRGPLPCRELAASLGIAEAVIYRYMRGLALCKIVKEVEKNIFELTAVGKLFITSIDNSLHGFALQNAQFYKAWGSLLEAVRSDKTAFELAFGQSFFDFLSTNPTIEHAFNETMHMHMLRIAEDLCAKIDLTNCSHIVDVGGGYGTIAKEISKNFPHIHCVVFDRDSVIANIDQHLCEGLEFISGDFFKEIPWTDGIYILSHVLHDWVDDECEIILSNCRKNMRSGQSIVIIEQILPELLEGYSSAVEFDLTMFVLTGGRERSEAEYRQLFLKTGFLLSEITPSVGGNYFLEICAI